MIFRQTKVAPSPPYVPSSGPPLPMEVQRPSTAPVASSEAIFSYKINGAVAQMRAIGAEFVVLAGSKLVGQETSSIGDLPRRLRRLGLESGALVRTDDGAFLRVERDIPTKSVSAAAQLVSGNSVNGMKVWTLDELEMNFGQWTAELGQIRKEVLQ